MCKINEKAVRVVDSCRTPEQMAVARRYVELAFAATKSGKLSLPAILPPARPLTTKTL